MSCANRMQEKGRMNNSKNTFWYQNRKISGSNLRKKNERNLPQLFVKMKEKGVKLKVTALIREKIQNGVPAAVVAEALHLHISSIRRIFREGKHHPRKHGSPKKMNKIERCNLMQEIREDVLQSASNLAKKLGNQVSITTIH